MSSLQSICDLRDSMYAGTMSLTEQLMAIDKFIRSKGTPSGKGCLTLGKYHSKRPASSAAASSSSAISTVAPKRQKVVAAAASSAAAASKPTVSDEWINRQLEIGMTLEEIVSMSRKALTMESLRQRIGGAAVKKDNDKPMAAAAAVKKEELPLAETIRRLVKDGWRDYEIIDSISGRRGEMSEDEKYAYIYQVRDECKTDGTYDIIMFRQYMRQGYPAKRASVKAGLNWTASELDKFISSTIPSPSEDDDDDEPMAAAAVRKEEFADEWLAGLENDEDGAPHGDSEPYGGSMIENIEGKTGEGMSLADVAAHVKLYGGTWGAAKIKAYLDGVKNGTVKDVERAEAPDEEDEEVNFDDDDDLVDIENEDGEEDGWSHKYNIRYLVGNGVKDSKIVDFIDEHQGNWSENKIIAYINKVKEGESIRRHAAASSVSGRMRTMTLAERRAAAW